MNDITLNPDRTSHGSEPLQRDQFRERSVQEPQYQQAMQMNTANAVACPHCGALNEPDALFCASCRNAIGMTKCPNCGAEVDADADFCESCRHYIRRMYVLSVAPILQEQRHIVLNVVVLGAVSLVLCAER